MLNWTLYSQLGAGSLCVIFAYWILVAEVSLGGGDRVQETSVDCVLAAKFIRSVD